METLRSCPLQPRAASNGILFAAFVGCFHEIPVSEKESMRTLGVNMRVYSHAVKYRNLFASLDARCVREWSDFEP
jgi:hypothetical protein